MAKGWHHSKRGRTASMDVLRARMERLRHGSLPAMHPFTNRLALILSIIAGTLLTALIYAGGYYNVLTLSNVEWDYVLLMLGLNLVLFYVNFLFCFAMARRAGLTRTQFVLYSIGGVLVIVIVYSLVVRPLLWWVVGSVPVQGTINLAVVRGVVIGATAVLITVMLYNVTQTQRVVQENQQLVEDNVRIRYDTLVKQIDPHFLFNSLNTLSGLIEEDSERSKEYVQQLAQVYRYIVQTDELVSLKEELRFADDYISLLQIRYGNSLQVQRHVLPEALTRRVVPISVQLLIENAVKHNVISNSTPLQIGLSTPDADTLLVSNTLQPKKEKTTGRAVGLVNLAERYRLVSKLTIRVEQTEGEFRVFLPLLSKPE